MRRVFSYTLIYIKNYSNALTDFVNFDILLVNGIL